MLRESGRWAQPPLLCPFSAERTKLKIVSSLTPTAPLNASCNCYNSPYVERCYPWWYIPAVAQQPQRQKYVTCLQMVRADSQKFWLFWFRSSVYEARWRGCEGEHQPTWHRTHYEGQRRVKHVPFKAARVHMKSCSVLFHSHVFLLM